MLTDQDIKKLTDVFATREEIDQRFIKIDQRFEESRQDIDKRFDDQKQDFINLQTAVDNYARRADAFFQEMVVLNHRVNRHEK